MLVPGAALEGVSYANERAALHLKESAGDVTVTLAVTEATTARGHLVNCFEPGWKMWVAKEYWNCSWRTRRAPFWPASPSKSAFMIIPLQKMLTIAKGD